MNESNWVITSVLHYLLPLLHILNPFIRQNMSGGQRERKKAEKAASYIHPARDSVVTDSTGRQTDRSCGKT